LYVHYYGIRKLELLFVTLVFIMAITFCSNMIIAEPDLNSMVSGLIIPAVPAGSWPAALGLIGAVIMPHNLYLHSSLVLTRRINHKNKNEVQDACIYNTIESSISLIISFIISTSVISTFAVYIINNPGSTELNLE
jgi:natural resistance-associated macrophage protein 2